MTDIDRNSPYPLYYQLKTILLEKIHSGEWGLGSLIPSENQLQDDYSVSRTTIRQTLQELVTEGYLLRERGRGTFVAAPKVTYNPAKQFELNEYMQAQGVVLGWRMMDSEWVEASEQVAAIFGIREGSQVWQIRRLRMADTRPIGYHISYLPKSLVQYIDEACLEKGQSLDYLKPFPKLKESHLQRTLEATIADKLDMDWLDAAPNTAILQLERILFSSDKQPLELLIARFRGDRFKYQITS
jgi:GntR family transcriptional regulator